MPGSHGQQKQREKQKKKREVARRKHTLRPSLVGQGEPAVIRQAALLPMGPSFISADWEILDADRPRLVAVVVTRRAPGGILVPALALVDRTCLGVKNGFVVKPIPEQEIGVFLDQVGLPFAGGMVPCPVLVAQSVVYHALDYARALGFAPHRDFAEPLFGPRPEVLLDTPLARAAKPFFVAGPDDAVDRVLERLTAAVGAGNFDFMAPALRALPQDEEDD